jgi:hypothetical protein
MLVIKKKVFVVWASLKERIAKKKNPLIVWASINTETRHTLRLGLDRTKPIKTH